MIEKIFIKDYDNVKSQKVRAKYGYLASFVSLVFNLILAISKIVVGIIFNLVSVLADGLNNLTDGGSQLVSIVGIKVAELPADSKHPYGHARIEYVVGLAISIVIIVIGFELFGSSIDSIVHPVEKEFSVIVIGILACSIVVKLWLGFFNYRISKKINSLSLKATAMDSLNDSLLTLAVLVTSIVGMKTGVDLDAYCGIVLSILIFIEGVKLVKETISPILGENLDQETLDKLISRVKAYKGVKGVHDIIAHNYGPNKYFISLHVEVDRNVDVMESHELIDKIETEISNENIHLLIHMDPIVIDDPKLEGYKKQEMDLVKEKINSKASIHDFRMVDGKNRINLIFDVAVPYSDKKSDSEIKELIEQKTKEIDTKLFTVVNVDRF